MLTIRGWERYQYFMDYEHKQVCDCTLTHSTALIFRILFPIPPFLRINFGVTAQIYHGKDATRQIEAEHSRKD